MLTSLPEHAHQQRHGQQFVSNKKDFSEYNNKERTVIQSQSKKNWKKKGQDIAN